MGAFVSTPPPFLFNFFIHFYTPLLKNCGVLRYTLRSEIGVECTSVYPSDRPSATITFPLSILSIFQPILFKLYIRVDIWEYKLWIINGSILSNRRSEIALYVENWFRSFIFLRVDIRIYGCMGFQIV